MAEAFTEREFFLALDNETRQLWAERWLDFPYANLRRMPSMWTRSFFVSTAGNVSSATIQKYIAEQKTR